MPFFKKKPVIIEAVQYTGDESCLADIDVMGLTGYSRRINDDCDELVQLIIPTLEGDHAANPGDWIIKGVHGEFYPCKPEIFQKTYEEA